MKFRLVLLVVMLAQFGAFAVSYADDARLPADPLDGPPIVTAQAWVIADGKTGAVLWGRDESLPRKAASTTKMMTCYVVLQLAEADPKILDEIVTFSKRADDTGGSTAGIRMGESLSVRECLYGLMLPSGNDAGVALAEHFGERLASNRIAAAAEAKAASSDARTNFIAAMNRTAQSLGMQETTYSSTFGDGIGAENKTASPRDLAKLAATAMRNPRFAKYVGTRRHECEVRTADGSSRRIVWENTNRLLAIEGFDGIKTGTTTSAGYCLVSSARRGDDHLIVVVLGATSPDGRTVDSRNLVRWAWTQRGAAK